MMSNLSHMQAIYSHKPIPLGAVYIVTVTVTVTVTA